MRKVAGGKISFAQSGQSCRPTFLLLAIIILAFLLRIWRFVESGEIDEDEAFFFGRSMMLLNRETIWGWIDVLETDYGVSTLLANAANYLFLRGLGVPIDERTIQFPSLVFGILGVATAYLAVKEIVGDWFPALIVGAMVAVIPSQVVQSRSIAGNWMVATCLFWWVVYCFARYARRPSTQSALFAGVSLAVYLQTDGMQLLLLAFLPMLLWLLGDRRQDGQPAAVFWSSSGFALSLILCALVIAPPTLRFFMGAGRIDGWNPGALGRLETYAAVFAGAGLAVMLLALGTRFVRDRHGFCPLLLRMAHPLLLIPATLSLTVNVAVASSTYTLFGTPQGVLGHAFSKETGIGFYVSEYFRDIVGILGWPITILILVSLAPALWACRRSRGAAALGLLCLVTNLPWLFFVPPHSTGRAWYMLTCTTALAAFATTGLLQIARRVGRAWSGPTSEGLPSATVISAAVALAVAVTTIPFTLAQVTQKPVLGISMPWKNGANLPSKGTRAAFEYFLENTRTEETLFTDIPHWTPRFYLNVKSSRKFPKTAIRALPYMKRREIFSYFEEEGKTADWYVVSSRFLEQLEEDQMSGMSLRALAEGPGGSTQVWQRGYIGSVDNLTVAEGGEYTPLQPFPERSQ